MPEIFSSESKINPDEGRLIVGLSDLRRRTGFEVVLAVIMVVSAA